MSKLLESELAVVISGTSGFGRASEMQLAEAGARVVVVAQLDVKRAREVVAPLPGTGHLAATTITDSGAPDALAQEVSENLAGPIYSSTRRALRNPSNTRISMRSTTKSLTGLAS